MKSFLLYLFVFGSLVGLGRPSSEEILIDSVQQAWDKIQNYQADFSQTIISKALGSKEHSNGIIYVQKPQKLRWEPSSGTGLQILNNDEFWQIRVNKRRKQTQVDHYKDISKLVDVRSLSFLSGQIDIKKSYNYKILKNSSDSILLALSAKKGGGDTILAEILKPSYLLGALKMENRESESRIEFKNIQINVSLKGSLFEYQPGPGDVVYHH